MMDPTIGMIDVNFITIILYEVLTAEKDDRVRQTDVCEGEACVNDKRVVVVDLRVDIETEESAGDDIHREGTSIPIA